MWGGIGRREGAREKRWYCSWMMFLGQEVHLFSLSMLGRGDIHRYKLRTCICYVVYMCALYWCLCVGWIDGV